MTDDEMGQAEMEHEAVQDVARLMRTWAARLGPSSHLAQGLEANALEALRRLRDLDPA